MYLKKNKPVRTTSTKIAKNLIAKILVIPKSLAILSPKPNATKLVAIACPN